MELPSVLASLQKKPAERNSQDVLGMSAWLGANCGFFCGMQQEVVQMLCTALGHCVVEEGAQVFKQGQVGDCMYIVVEGYCSVLKHQQQQANISLDGNSRTCSINNGACTDPNIAGNTVAGQCASRRATTEQQVQHFALATGAVAQLAAGSAGLMLAGRQQSGSGLLRRGSSGSGSLILPALSRRATAEVTLQQQQSEAVHVGWVSQGESVGGEALINSSSSRTVSVVAGDGGVVMLVLDRVGWNKLTTQAQLQQGVAARAMQSVLAAACRQLLLTPPGKRSADDVETLTQLFSGVQAFQMLPAAVRLKLAKNCQSLSLPAGAVVFREDQKGDAMYVLLSGTCHVRARPLKPHKQPPPEATTVTDLAAIASPAPAADASSSTSQTSSTAGLIASMAPGSIMDSSAGATTGSRLQLARRTTWEGAAFTAQEQARLEAVRVALEADKHQVLTSKVSPATSTGGSTGGKGVEKDALYWTAKYMHDAATAATASNSHQESYGGLAPLAAVFAAKWRQQMRKQQVEQQTQHQQEEQTAAEDKAYAAMEELLGKAAAKAWKAARDGSSHSNSHANPADTVAEAREVLSDSGAQTGAAAQVAAGVLDLATATEHSSSCALEADPSMQHQQVSRISEQTESSGAATPRFRNHAAASAAAAGLLTAAAEACDPSESLKLQLAALGVHDPADVSRRLMEEVAQRADLDGLLAHVADILERKGLPRRLNKKGSRRITREVNKRMLGGGSWGDRDAAVQPQPTQPANTHLLQPNTAPLQPARARSTAANFTADGLQSGTAAGSKASNVKDSKTTSASHDDTRSEPDFEATGVSTSCDAWRSMDSTDAASAFMSYDAEPDEFDEGADYVGTSQAIASAAAAGSAVTKGCKAPAVRDCGNLVGTCLEPEALDEMYGPIIRVLSPGESFGELALLSRDATRTATVVVKQTEQSVFAEQQQTELTRDEAGTKGGEKCAATLIRISRSCYDASIRSLQISALKDLLDFLSGLPPFQSLGRDLLTTLAVFVRPVQLSQGQLLTIAGDKVEGLIVIQEGEVKLFETPVSMVQAASGQVQLSSGTGAAAANLPPQPRLRRGTADEVLLHRQLSSSGSINLATSSNNGTPALYRQLSNSNSTLGILAANRRSNSVGGSEGTMASVAAMQAILPTAGYSINPVALGKLSQTAAPLAVLGPGALLGENVLGYNPDQDPLDTIAAARGYKARQAAMAVSAALTHQATAVATRPCKVLLLSSEALRRFGRRVRAPLTQLAADRRDFLKQRRTAVQDAKSTLAQMMLNMKQQIHQGTGAVAAAGVASSNSSVVLPGSSAANMLTATRSLSKHASYSDNSGPVLPGSAASGSYTVTASTAAFSLASSNSTNSGSNLHKPGSLVSSSTGALPSAAAVALYRANSRNNRPPVSQWQQQQWQQNAFGELMRPAPAAQQVTVVDVQRLRQVVPGAQAPCVSELAAAARGFPIGALCATVDRPVAATVAPSVESTYVDKAQILHEPEILAHSVQIAPGSFNKKPSAKGLRALLVPQHQQSLSASLSAGPEHGLQMTGSATAVAAAGAAVGDRPV